MHPGIAIRQTVAVIVKTGTDIAEVKPDPLLGDRTGNSGCFGTGPPPEGGLDRTEVFVRHLVVAIGPDLVGHRGNLIAHRDFRSLVDPAGGVHPFCRVGPDVVIQRKIVQRIRSGVGHALTKSIFQGVGDKEILGDRLTGRDARNHPHRIAGAAGSD